MQDMRKSASSNQSNKGAKRRMRLWLFTMSCFLIWAAFTLWNQSGRLNAKAAQLNEMQGKLQQFKDLNEQYKLEVTRLNDPEYIEQKIRKDYHYTRNGETMFYTPKTNP